MSQPLVSGVTSERPVAFDPLADPRLYDGVLSRRVLAFLVDFTVVLTLTAAASVVIFFLGVLTLGLAWLLYGGVFYAMAVLYSGATLGGDRAATWGMRLTGLTCRQLDGTRPGFLIASAHVVFLYFSMTILTPFVLLVGLFTRRKQLLHDLILSTVILDRGRLEGRGY
ncbi:membrane protein [Methylopila jiangsuensis]|uniref:Membrane protein n=1 Tax=Methylopila jiangsuensis TaxID=586230 RepID=A0A9W6N2S0_9HYPH|nr:RDD family protein [Methylopila jiangsuensis]MDR6285780.1 putative RDD family membrane protein YckC [Methylopila jiangsuensis]GLK75538.1 membrane protein [Methylopila jiangsuensis]